MEVKLSASRPGALPPGKSSGTRWIPGRLGPRFGGDANKRPKQTSWPESACELYRPNDRCLSAKLVPTFADRGCHMVSATDPYGRIIGLLDRSRYFFFQIAPQLYSQGRVDPVPDPLLLTARNGHAVARAVSRRLLTEAAQVRARIIICAFCGGQSGTRADFYEYLGFFCQSFH
jgi:hypothetical protein